jgi:hypothetical protein
MPSPAARTAILLMASAFALSGCAALRPVTEIAAPVHNSIFPTVADSDGALPDWVPEDAVQIRVKASNSSDAAIVTYVSPTHYPADRCPASEAAPLPPMLRDSWWPQKLPAETVTCPDGWYAFAAGNTVYAWTGTRPASLAQ